MDPEILPLSSILGSPTPHRHPRAIRPSLLERFENQDAVLPRKMAKPLTPRDDSSTSFSKHPDLMAKGATLSRTSTPTSFSHLLAPEPRPSPSPSLSPSTSAASLRRLNPSNITASPSNKGSSVGRICKQHQAIPPSFVPEQPNAPLSPQPLPVAQSPRPRPSPAPPLRIVEDDDAPLRAAIMRNAEFLFPQYETGELSIATGMTPPDEFTEPTAFALVFASEARRQDGQGPGAALVGRPKRVVRELVKSPMGCLSRRRALEGLLVECEVAVGVRVLGPPVKEEIGGGESVGLGMRGWKGEDDGASLKEYVVTGRKSVERRDSKNGLDAATPPLMKYAAWANQ